MWSCSASKPVSTSESAAGPEILIQAMSSTALFRQNLGDSLLSYLHLKWIGIYKLLFIHFLLLFFFFSRRKVVCCHNTPTAKRFHSEQRNSGPENIRRSGASILRSPPHSSSSVIDLGCERCSSHGFVSVKWSLLTSCTPERAFSVVWLQRVWGVETFSFLTVTEALQGEKKGVEDLMLGRKMFIPRGEAQVKEFLLHMMSK